MIGIGFFMDSFFPSVSEMATAGEKVDLLILGVSFFKHSHLSEPALIFEKYTGCFSDDFMAFLSQFTVERCEESLGRW